jgi:integrase
MRLYQRSSVWYIDYSFNGKRVRKRIGPSREHAEDFLAEITRKIRKGNTKGLDRQDFLFFEKVCDEYLNYSKANKAKSSYRRDQISISNLLNAFCGKLITDITAYELERYKNKRRDKVKPATVNRELACIKHMFTKAFDWELIKENTTKCVKLFKEPPGRIRYLSEEEMKRLLDCCRKYLRPIVVMALNTGMRKSEILALKWSDVDMINRMIKITNSKNNETRYVPINDTLFATLIKMPNCSTGEMKVFAWDNGKPIKYINNGFYNAMKRANIINFRFHDLRHTFASHLVMKGVDIRIIQQLLGHKTLAMTMRYSHVSNDAMKAAVDKLDLVRIMAQK